MSQSINKVRRRQVTVYYTDDEYAHLQEFFARSTDTHLAAYVRKVSLVQPVEIKIRNASFDDFLSAVIPLQKELRTLRRLNRFTPENEAALLEIHRGIQQAIEKITLPCMPS